MIPDYIEIPTWPEYNNQNRVYLGGGICPTLTTQCSHSKPPLVLVGGARMKIQNATRQGWLEAEPGDGVVLNLLGRARGRVQKEKSPTLHTGGGVHRGDSNDRH